MVASNDLERLQRLLDDAAHGADGTSRRHRQLDAGAGAPARAWTRTAGDPRDGSTLASAITALQFQDMATQLIATPRAGCATAPTGWRATPSATTTGTAPPWSRDRPLRPNPVTQDEMDAGSDRAV